VLGLNSGERSNRFQSSPFIYSLPLKQPSKNNPNAGKKFAAGFYEGAFMESV